MTTHQFETLEPVDLYVENGSGSVTITADDTTETTVEVTGRHADETTVEPGRQADQRDRAEDALRLPRRRQQARHGDHGADGQHPRRQDRQRRRHRHRQLPRRPGEERLRRRRDRDPRRTGLVETGSGDIRIDTADQDLRVKSGSGDVRVQYAGGAIAVSTGSGDVEIGTSNAPAVVKTGSGDLDLRESRDDVTMSTGSGDLVIRTAHRGQLTAKGASGDVQIGIPAGVPVWTDVTTVSGEIRSGLEGVGEPEEGADHVELRAKTVSGDIVLTQV